MAYPLPWKALSKYLMENAFRRQHCRRRDAPMCAKPQSRCSSARVGSSALLPSLSRDLEVPWEVQHGGWGHLSVPTQESLRHPHAAGSGAPTETHFAFLMRCPEGSPGLAESIAIPWARCALQYARVLVSCGNTKQDRSICC